MRTPNANLVAGMSWFQNSFTRRINANNGLWGHSDRELRSSKFLGDHAEKKAESSIEAACEHFGKTEKELRQKRPGDLTRTAVAWAIWKRTSVKQRCITERLSMGTASNVSQQVRKFDATPEKSLPSGIRRWKKMRNDNRPLYSIIPPHPSFISVHKNGS